MRYIDSGNRDPSQAVGGWLTEEFSQKIEALKVQTGFFSSSGLGIFSQALEQLKAEDKPASFVIGSNEGGTVGSHVSDLAEQLGIPRKNASLGAISYATCYFHPKTYHITRPDGSQTAFVGSANLGSSGLSGFHIEAGVLLDTREGDPVETLKEIEAAVDIWFSEDRDGFEDIQKIEDIEQLIADKFFRVSAPPKPSSSQNPNNDKPTRPKLKPLIKIPQNKKTSDTQDTTDIAPEIHPKDLVSVLRPPFPPYSLFEPNASSPTEGAKALTGSTLPGNSAGLIIRMNKDSARHWRGGQGTANISIPIPTLTTIRFGILNGSRPRAQFPFIIRYLSDDAELVTAESDTNIMMYSYSDGDTGHQDVRMGIRKAPAKEMLDLINAAGLVSPDDGDVALLEWPTLENSRFRLNLLDQNSKIAEKANALLDQAVQANEVVGKAATWLPSGFLQS